MNPTVVTYLLYISISVGLTIWVARTLARNGEIFLVDVFHGAEKVAAATNHLLVVGFYLLNLGFVALMLRVGEPVPSAQEAIEALATKLWAVMLLLGALHLMNVLVLTRVRRQRHAPAARSLSYPAPQGWPPAPQGWPPPPPAADRGGVVAPPA